jgi:tRNA pseudouridine55 synthase
MDGALIIDKPAGLTSHDVIARVRKTIAERRVGHTGTLDPFATGVLVILVGRATRLAQFLSGAEKEYEALIRFGYRTDTGDITGQQIEEEQSHAKAQSTRSLREEEIKTALSSFRGEIEQTPPMYSAKKVGGRKLYELARRGEAVERKPVRVTISELECISQPADLVKSNDDGTQDLKVRVVCSAGTYIRTLAEDLGQNLGIGAHLAELRRTRAGKFKIEDAMTLDEVSELKESGSFESKLISPFEVLSHLPAIELDSDDARRTVNGIELRIHTEEAPWTDGQPVRMCQATGELLAVGFYDQGRAVVRPRVVIKDKL